MKLKLRKISLIVLLLITLPLSVVNAQPTVNMNLTSASELVAGQTVEVNLAITSIDAGEGIDALVGKINYDKNVFEELTEEGFEGKNRWNFQIFSPETGLFTLSKSSKVNTNSEVLKLTLKVKEGVNLDSTKISMTDVVVSGGAVSSGGTGDIEVGEISVTINAKQEEQTPTPNPNPTPTPDPDPEPTPTPTPTPTPDPDPEQTPAPDINPDNNNSVGVDNTISDDTTVNDNNNTVVGGGNTGNGNNTGSDKNQSTTIKNNVSNNTTSKGKLPQTGVQENIIVCIAILVVVGIGIFSYRRYKYLNIK